jgi:Ni2+-binding GTPase involved in maturation of urease and hydrogenase
MKLVIFAGPPTCGKTTVIRQVLKRMAAREIKTAYVKIDVLYADDDTIIAKEFGIPVKKVYSGELCPDHCNVLVLDEAVEWAEKAGASYVFIETAGLCLRCSPYVENSLGIVVLVAQENRPDAHPGRYQCDHKNRPHFTGRTGSIPLPCT